MTTKPSIGDLDPNLAASTVTDGLRWFDVRTFGIEGKGWSETEHFYDRLPLRAKGVVRETIWDLSQYSAGLRVRFTTDATTVAAQWTLRRERLAINLMAATGCSGMDLYARDGERWRFAGVGRPNGLHNQATLVSDMTAQSRQFMIYLPLYNGIESMRIGVPQDAAVSATPPYAAADPRPICFYGTSINMGGCASRPGMCHIAILQRRLDRPVLNLGFAGNAKSEPELAAFIAELDPCCFVVDPLSNMSVEQIHQRVPVFLETLRRARPNTPILLVGCINYANAWINQARGEAARTKTAALYEVYCNLATRNFAHLHYTPGDNLLGTDDEGTVDGTHPTDAGFLRMADALEPVIRTLLTPGVAT